MEDIIQSLKIGKINIIGSYTDKDKRYYSDIDIDDLVETDKRSFLNSLQYKLKYIMKNPNIYFIEFKAGIYGGRSVKWTYDEIMDEHRYIDNKRVDLLGTLNNASNVKLDLIILDRYKKLLPITISYKFKKDYVNNRGYESNLYLEAQRLEDDDKYFEALKKWYLYYKSRGERKKVNDILDILNSKFGLIYTKLYKLREIKRLLDSNNNYKLDDIQNNFIDIRDTLPSDISHIMLPLISTNSIDSIRRNIDKAISSLDKYINDEIKNLI